MFFSFTEKGKIENIDPSAGKTLPLSTTGHWRRVLLFIISEIVVRMSAFLNIRKSWRHHVVAEKLHWIPNYGCLSFYRHHKNIAFDSLFHEDTTSLCNTFSRPTRLNLSWNCKKLFSLNCDSIRSFAWVDRYVLHLMSTDDIKTSDDATSFSELAS